MRGIKYIFLPAILCYALVASASDTAFAGPANPFMYTVLAVGEEPGESDISSFGDTVVFVLYFVDTECDTYYYDYRVEKQTVSVTRKPVSGRPCDRDGQMIYGVSGRITGVNPGRYWFILRSTCAGKSEELLKEAVEVKKAG